MIGICGDNCACCPRYIATKSGDLERLERVKALWVRLELRGSDFPAEKMACHGCQPENKCAYVELCACVSERSGINCGFCDEYPCKLINYVFDKTDKLRSVAVRVCTHEEMDMLDRAFFSKKEYFDCIHAENCRKA